MFKKNLIISLFFLLILNFILARDISAKHKSEAFIPPEKNGLYNDTDHPGIRVQVFVHTERPEITASNKLSCGLPDEDSQVKVGRATWKLPKGNFTYNLNKASAPSTISDQSFSDAVENSFDQWVTAIDKKVTFENGLDTLEVESKYDGKNIIAWDKLSGANVLGITYVRYNASNGLVVDIDTILNKRITWGWSESSNTCAIQNAYDVENSITHELGHWFGLDDEDDSSYQNATMYGYILNGEVKKTTLTTGDISGITSIYLP